MITAKRTVCLLLASICLLLSGCASEPYPFEELFTETESEPIRYALIIPKESESEYESMAEDLAAKIAETLGNQTRIYTDGDPLPEEEDWVSVAIGPVSLPWVTQAQRSLRSRDYLCTWTEEGICIGGRTALATEKAITRFVTDLLPSATQTELVPKLGGIRHEETYRVEALTLNGSPISEYRIEYEAQYAKTLLPMANDLYEKIEQISGEMLTVGEERVENSKGKRILLRQENPYGSSHTAYVSEEGESILLCGKEAFGTSVALQRFCEILLAEEEGSRWAKSVRGLIAIPYDAPTLTLGSFSMDHDRTFTTFTEVNETVALIRKTPADLVLLGNLAAGKISYLTDSMSEYRLPYATAENLITTNTCPQVTERKPNILRVGGEAYGFLLCLLPDGSTDWQASLSEAQKESDLPLLVILHGKSQTVEQREGILQEMGLISALRQSYECGKESLVLSCFATRDAFRIHMSGLDTVVGYGRVTLERPRIELE